MKTFAFALLYLLGSCSSLTKDDCKNIDWNRKGFEEGSRGETSNIRSYENQCRDFGISAPLSGYVDGHRKGLKQFCTYKNGHDLALSGSMSVRDCEVLSVEYTRGYREGEVDKEELDQKNKEEKEEEEKRDDCCAHWTAGGECVHELIPGCSK